MQKLQDHGQAEPCCCSSDLFWMCRAHRLNEYSSRSHCVMTLHIETGSSLNSSQGGRPGSAADPAHMRRFGKLVLVDLAGSERLKVGLTTWSAGSAQMGTSVQNLTSLWGNALSSACSPIRCCGCIFFGKTVGFAELKLADSARASGWLVCSALC